MRYNSCTRDGVGNGCGWCYAQDKESHKHSGQPDASTPGLLQIKDGQQGVDGRKRREAAAKWEEEDYEI